MSQPVPQWERPPSSDVGPLPPAPDRADVVPASVQALVWRGDAFGQACTSVTRSGWDALDAELPGGGWPAQCVTEVLATQPSILEWRLLGPALRTFVAAGRQLVVVGPPRHPHLPGLLHEGLDERQLVWIQAEVPAQRLWVTEQLIKSNAGAVISWLPQARQEQLRRLQVCSQGCDVPVFLCRPEAARHEASAAPLRVLASLGLDWELCVSILKRRGPAHDKPIVLPSVPGGLTSVLTPRLRKPSCLISREAADAVGRPAVATRPRHQAAAQ
jgi:protein ImuA